MTGRGLRGRRTAGWMLSAAIGLDVALVVLFVTGPNYMGSMSVGPASPLVLLVPGLGIAWNLTGLGVMIRIYRADPEAGRSSFRATRN